MAEWVDHVGRLTGNPVAEIVVDVDEFRSRANEPLWEQIEEEGIVLAGRPLQDLVSADTTPATGKA